MCQFFLVLVKKVQSLEESSLLSPDLAKDITEFGRIRNNLIHNVNYNHLNKATRKHFIEKYENATLQLKNIAEGQQK